MTTSKSAQDFQFSTTITKSRLAKVERVCKQISFKTGVPVEDLYSECLSKIPNVQKNYNLKAETIFEAYLLISMRGYALNYCRDKSFLSSVGRKDLLIYTKSKKYPNLEMAAASMLVPVEKLRQIHHEIKVLRSYNSVDTADSWKLPIDLKKSKNISAVLSQFLSQDEVDIAVKSIVEGKTRGIDLAEVERIRNIVLENKEMIIDYLYE